MTVPTVKDAAHRYASIYRWSVFPLRPRDKRPLSLHGFHDATLDTGQIESWWTESPTAGIGIATGQASGLVVLDVDPRNGGTESLEAIRAQHGPLPETPEAITGGGGRHYFFSVPKGEFLPSAKPWPGIDIKAEGGYVCACPTIHPSGQMYLWREARHPDALPVAPAPTWLTSLLHDRMKRMVSEAKSEVPSGPAVYKAGSRNDALASLAGTMQRRGMSFEAIVAALLAENEAKCKPPLPEREVTIIARSVARYAPEPGAIPTPTFARSLGHTTMSLAGALSSPPADTPWILEGWLSHGDISMLAGEPTIGKSWLILDLAVAGALGLPVWGYFPLDSPFKVLLVDEENAPDEVVRRLWCVAQAHGVQAGDLIGDLEKNLLIMTPRQGFSFRRPESIGWLRSQIEEFRPDLIIFDSLTAIASYAEEDKASAIRRFYHDQLSPLQAINGSTILLVHHTNKEVYRKEREIKSAGLVRGSIDMVAAPDSAFLLDRREDKIILHNIKVRRGKTPLPLEIEIVDTCDEDGTPNQGVRPLIRGTTDARNPFEFLPNLGTPAAEAALLALRGGPLSTKDLHVQICQLVGEQLSTNSLKWVLSDLRRAKKVIAEKMPDRHKMNLYRLPETP